MHLYRATIRWVDQGPDFLQGKYSREHTWAFDGGLTVPASSAPSNVPLPWSKPENLDPEEAFVAAIASCHMLTFLFLASKAGLQITSYEDSAIGRMEKNELGTLWVSEVTLNPVIVYAGTSPSKEVEHRLHHEAHQQCFIANSVKTRIVVAER